MLDLIVTVVLLGLLVGGAAAVVLMSMRSEGEASPDGEADAASGDGRAATDEADQVTSPAGGTRAPRQPAGDPVIELDHVDLREAEREGEAVPVAPDSGPTGDVGVPVAAGHHPGQPGGGAAAQQLPRRRRSAASAGVPRSGGPAPATLTPQVTEALRQFVDLRATEGTSVGKPREFDLRRRQVHRAAAAAPPAASEAAEERAAGEAEAGSSERTAEGLPRRRRTGVSAIASASVAAEQRLSVPLNRSIDQIRATLSRYDDRGEAGAAGREGQAPTSVPSAAPAAQEPVVADAIAPAEPAAVVPSDEVPPAESAPPVEVAGPADVVDGERDFDAAWAEINAGGAGAGLWLEQARACESTNPRDAVPIYQAEVERLIGLKKNNAYQSATELLDHVAKLMADEGLSEAFTEYVDAVVVRHKRKRNLMKLMAERGWVPPAPPAKS